ncbi:hypothetical protein GH714_007345 [Hevea brasiliensis]|uniref:EF-hand domain-containing protein n=1 Tax=Hevea brasiliensis TaxID=3981 RepID=A0A6A6KBE0_HEVBR|nr:hypothetical protein GH714_007345 [Hevea brasiliensis]
MEISSGPIGSCSKKNQKIYLEWFNFADSDGDGRINGSDAIKFFGMSNFISTESQADSKRLGYLGFNEFISAMRLVSLAQAGHEITDDLLNSNVDYENLKPPSMEGLDVLIAVTNKRRTSKLSDPDINGTPPMQTSPSVNWFSSKPLKKVPLSSVTSIIDGLKRLYIQKLKPLEVTYRFNDFVSPLLKNSDFDAKPMVMLLGQYSTGKKTFIKHLLKSGYPGAHIGPEPTTDRMVMLLGQYSTGKTTFIKHLLKSGYPGAHIGPEPTTDRFVVVMLLEHITFVDTPGVLSGEKQRTQRAYDFTGVTSWFAAKCDLILLLFDPHKLDISDEFKRVISSLRGHDDKIRVVLNKADQIDTQQLKRVYGALMWSLGKVLNTPEVVRVYIGSFNDKPVNEAAVGPIGKELFEKEQEDLLSNLKDIPKKACDRRINEFVKRARAAKIHAYIISHLKKEMLAMMGKAKAQQRLIDNLADEFGKVLSLSLSLSLMFKGSSVLRGYNIDKFEKLKPKMIQAVDDMLGYDIPELLKNFRNPYD